MNNQRDDLEPFTIYLSLLVPGQTDQVEVRPHGNNLFQICFDKGTLAMAVKTPDGWQQLDKGEHPTPDFQKITQLIDAHYLQSSKTH